MTPLEHLIAARAKIEKPENWTKYQAASNKDKLPVSAKDPSATCWCSYGALYAVSSSDCGYFEGPVERYLDKAAFELGAPQEFAIYIDFNDEHTHEEVLAMFDRAIELARADEVKQGEK